MGMMRKMRHLLVLAAAVAGITAGVAVAGQAQGFRVQCWSLNGSSTCDMCYGECMGADYICCGGETELQ